jgi:tetratricopeptide (TPR) repeat protein
VAAPSPEPRSAAAAPAPTTAAAPSPRPAAPPAPAAPEPVAPAGPPPSGDLAHAEPAKGGSRVDPGAGKPKTYERLVAEGDRALENGQTARAQRAYDEALKLQPEGVAAITGSAYLLLDRQRTLAAIGLFKRALVSAPAFPAALFGLGEAYRAQGDNAQAVEVYKRYLAASPSGQDAPAARRQVKELSEAAPAPRRGDNGPSRIESARADAPKGQSASPDKPAPPPAPPQQ